MLPHPFTAWAIGSAAAVVPVSGFYLAGAYPAWVAIGLWLILSTFCALQVLDADRRL